MHCAKNVRQVYTYFRQTCEKSEVSRAPMTSWSQNGQHAEASAMRLGGQMIVLKCTVLCELCFNAEALIRSDESRGENKLNHEVSTDSSECTVHCTVHCTQPCIA